MKFENQVARKSVTFQRIPLFNHVFRGAYGRKGIAYSLILGAISYAFALLYVSPWREGYTLEERILLISFVGIGGLVAFPCIMSYLVEFGLNLIDLIRWKIEGVLELNASMKALLIVIAVLSVIGGALYSHPTHDIWGIYCLFMLTIVTYLLVLYAWTWNYVNHMDGPQSQQVDGVDE